MSSRKRFALLTALLVLVNVAGLVWIHHDLTARPAAEIKISQLLPDAAVDDTERIVLVFDRDAAPPQMLNTPLTEAPFTMEPAAGGQWTWQAPDRLELKLAQPLAGATEYTLRATPTLETSTGRRLAGETSRTLRTRPLELLDYRVVQNDPTSLEAIAEFSLPVDPAALEKGLSVSGGRPDPKGRVRIECITNRPNKTIRMLLHNLRQTATLTLPEDLYATVGNLPIQGNRTMTVSPPEQLMLTGTTTDVPSIGEHGVVRIRFNRPLASGQSPAVTVQPTVDNLAVRCDGHQLVLEGAFAPDSLYRITVPADLKDSQGRTLDKPLTTAVSIQPCWPSVNFRYDGGCLSPRGNLELDLNTVNVPSIAVEVRRVYPNNLVVYKRWPYRSGLARSMASRTIPLDTQPNVRQQLALSLKDLIDNPRGLYIIEARSTEAYWTRDRALVAVTDLALTVKQYPGGCLVWVGNLGDGQPVAGVDVQLHAASNQVLARGITADDGTVRIDVPQNHPDGPVYLVTASKGDDTAFLEPGNRRWVTDEVDRSGRSTPTTCEAMLYADRGVHRPGETIHLTGILRLPDGSIPGAFPLELRVVRPDRKVVHTVALGLSNPQRIFHVSVSTSPGDMTGPYRFEVAVPGADHVMGSTSTLVEAFMPIRMEVDLSAPDRLNAGDKLAATLTGRYLFGLPAAGVPYEARGDLIEQPFKSILFADYSFCDPDRHARANLVPQEGALDEQGQAPLTFSLQEAPPPGFYRMQLSATVTEPGSRAVSGGAVSRVDLADRAIGLLPPARNVVNTESPIEIPYVQLTSDDRPADPVQMKIELYRVEYDWTIERVNGRQVWKNHQRLIPVAAPTVVPDAEKPHRGTLNFALAGGGRYRLSVTDTASTVATVIGFYAWRGAQSAESHLVARPDRLEIVPERNTYAPGDMLRASVRGPFAGRLFVTLEADRVLSHQVVEMSGTSTQVDLRIPKDATGSVYLAASVVRPVDPSGDKWTAHRAFGLARIELDHSANRLPVVVELPEKVGPETTVTVRVKTPAPADPDRPVMVHLWAVDEGVLAVTRYRTPDPHHFFFGPRRLDVATSDSYFDLLPDYRRPESIHRIGAGGYDDSLRRSPVALRHREAVVLWQTVAPCSADGSLEVAMAVPQYTGRLRVMAVAVDGNRYGSAEGGLTVTSPVLVESGWPRFASNGDRFEAPIKLFNTEQADLTADVSVKLAGPLTLMRDGKPLPAEKSGNVQVVRLGKVDLPAESSKSISLTGLAGTGGDVSLTVIAETTLPDGRKLVARSEGFFSVRAGTVMASSGSTHALKAGQELVLDAPEDMLPNVGTRTLRIGASPVVELLPAVQQVIGYPYGCAEQTTSKLIAMIRAPQLLEQAGGDEASGEPVQRMIRSGLNRLQLMQTSSGGIGYWSGSNRPSLWASDYVAQFLVRAHDSGIKLDRDFVGQLCAWLAAQLADPEDIGKADDLRASILHTLAVLDKPRTNWMDRLAERSADLGVAGRAHLASAFAAVGRRDKALRVLGEVPPAAGNLRTHHGYITSSTYEQAVMLEALLTIKPDHPWIPRLVQQVNDARVGCRWTGTMENAACLSALARYQLTQDRNAAFTGTVAVGDDAPVAFSHDKPLSLTLPVDDRPIAITTRGTGTIFVASVTEGLSKTMPEKRIDRGLSVERRWLDRHGRPVDPSAIRAGDLIQVELVCKTLAGATVVDNVAIVDALPAGLEVENPRLDTSERTGFGEAATPDRIEFLDDRVLVFTTVSSEPRTFRYAVRAVTVGRFAACPLQASSMYDPTLQSVQPGVPVEVTR